MLTSSGLTTSVTTGSPVASLASAKSFSPLSFRPWKLYGEVLGLNAPPLKIVAPAALTLSATSNSCSLLSTAQGPAMSVNAPHLRELRPLLLLCPLA